MAGLVPAIHVFDRPSQFEDVHAREKRGAASGIASLRISYVVADERTPLERCELGLWNGVAVDTQLEQEVRRNARSRSARRSGADEIIAARLAFAAGFQRRRPHVVSQAISEWSARSETDVEALQNCNAPTGLVARELA
jgi:hypothetical protein